MGNHGSAADDTDYVDSYGNPTDASRYARVELPERPGQTAEQAHELKFGAAVRINIPTLATFISGGYPAP